MTRGIMAAAALTLIAGFGAARAQAPAPLPYGEAISLELAKKAAAAAAAEVPQAGSPPDCIAIVDPGGHLVYFERMENAQIGSIRVAIGKARTAVLFRRPSKVFEDFLAKGRNAVLGFREVIPSEGGLPIVIGGKVVGAIGASGGSPEQDGKVAAAGLAAINK